MGFYSPLFRPLYRRGAFIPIWGMALIMLGILFIVMGIFQGTGAGFFFYVSIGVMFIPSGIFLIKLKRAYEI